MPRGPRKFLKRVYAPKHWMLDKLSGNFAPKPSAGPHKLRESVPLIVLLRNRLKYALNYREVITIVKNKAGNVKVDNKVRKDPHFPAGFMDVVSIEKSNEFFRMLYDMKGRFVLHKIPVAEAKFKLCKIMKKGMGMNQIPYIVTHDGRTVRFPMPELQIGDTVKLNLEENKVEGHLKFETGSLVMATGGNNVGRYGTIFKTERHLGSYDIVHVKEANGNTFATRKENLFVIGQAQQSWISLPKGKPYKLSIMEEKAERMLRKDKKPEKMKKKE